MTRERLLLEQIAMKLFTDWLAEKNAAPVPWALLHSDTRVEWRRTAERLCREDY